MPRSWIVSASLCLLLSAPTRNAFAQTNLSLPGCEASPEVRQTLRDKLNSPQFYDLSYVQRMDLTEQVLTGLIQNYPREVEPYRLLVTNARDQQVLHPEKLAALQAAYQKQAADHPNDPLQLYLAAIALQRKDTPASVHFADRAIELAPGFAWPALYLAELYSHGKLGDKEKSAENLKRFFDLCPASMEPQAQWLLSKDTELEAKVQPAERAYLESATDPVTLENYTTLWSLEFRLSPPQGYAALRKQVAADLARLEKANPKPDAAWAAFLLFGYKQSGAPSEVITAREDQLLAAYPHSEQALRIVEERWMDAHKRPEKQDDTAAWAQYHAAYRTAVQEWLRAYPNAYHELVQVAFYAADNDDSISEADGMAALNAFLKDGQLHWGPEPWVDQSAAEFLLDHHWQPLRALQLLEQERDYYVKADAISATDDNLSETFSENVLAARATRHMNRITDTLLAATRAGKPDAALKLKASIEAPLPKDEKLQSGYWQNRALLAGLEGHKADSLVYYQLALQTRQEQPKFINGELKDELGDEARDLWRQMGGSPTAWAAWTKQPLRPFADASTARWEKPKQLLPDFTLTDLSGKSWKLADLHGKVLLINVWATWCTPCNAELPHLEKLYEQVKDRPDVQILTFDVDEDPGLLGHYLKEKGYTFPVLLAYSYTLNLLSGVAIPQNWIVDAKGAWTWTQIGFGGSDSWQKDMLAKIDAVKAAQ